MDVTGPLARRAARRLHVLLVPVPGAAAVRWAAEEDVARRGWVPAGSVGDADLLLVCGRPGPELSAVVDATVGLLPRPAGQSAAAAAVDVAAALDQAAAQWAADGLRPLSTGPAVEHDAPDGDPGDDMDDMDGMDGMDMTGPGGLPLAGGAPDRDGLEMDVLHVPVGPVLPCWPAGLVLTCTLAGDVVTGAGVQLLPAAGPAPAAPADDAVRADVVAGVLQLAGRDDLARPARRARALVLAGDPTAQVEWVRVQRAVARSRLLRWSLRGVGMVDPVLVAEHRLPAGLAGDVHTRLTASLAEQLTGGSAGAEPAWPGLAPEGWQARLLGLLPHLVGGHELAAVRLLLAGLPLDVAPDRQGVPRG